MSANKKIIFIVIMGVSACLIIFGLSQYFSKTNQNNQLLLSQIQQLSAKVEYIQLLSKDFIQNGNEANWRKIIENLEVIGPGLGMAPNIKYHWKQEVGDLTKQLAEYRHALSRIHDPAIELNAEKDRLQGMGLTFSKEVKDRIIEPYRKEEGQQIYKGYYIDPFKSRIKETAYDLIGLHLQQQHILLEFLLDWDVDEYQRKKQTIAQSLERQKAQLHYMNILMGTEADIGQIIDSLNQKMTTLANQEQLILGHFSTLTGLNVQLVESGDKLRQASDKLSARIVSDISNANKLNRFLSWGLLIFILGSLALLGSMLARDIIHFVEDLKANRRKLKNSENKLKVTLNSLGDAVIATDEHGVVTRMNPMAEKLTGWSSTEAVGQPLSAVFRIVNAQTRQTVANPVEEVLAKKKIVELANHTMLIAKNGQEYQIADSGAPIRDKDGGILGVVLVFRDVTQNYAQEQKLRNNEKQLKDITANVPGVVYQFRSTTDHVYSMSFVSEKATEIFGLDADPRTFFENFSACIPESEKDRFLSSIHEAVDNVIAWHYEGRFIMPGGKEIWFSANSIPHREGDAIVFYGVLMDITPRKILEESLRLTQFCLDKASIGIFRIGNQGQILDVNEQACQSLGYSKEELCRMAVFDIDPNFSPAMWPKHLENLRAPGPRVIETLHKHKNGTTFPVQILISMMSFKHQEFHVAFVQDVSERKKAEKKARRLEAALLQAQKMEAIGTLAGGIAHDFNNILSAVIGYSELSLDMTEAGSFVHQNLKKTITAGLRARDLVQQILTFSRKDERLLSPLQAAPLVKESLKLLRSSLPATIEISQNITNGADNVIADPTQIHQIVMNLCTNAAHAMEADGGHLKLSLSQVQLLDEDTRMHPGLLPGHYLKLSVQDTGCGIPPENMEKIFDPYFTTKEKGKGTGLGLSVVHGLVKSLGGAIYVYSEPDSGTTFHVYIPAVKTQTQAIEKASFDMAGGSEHILLIDDEQSIVEVERLFLEKLGYRVSTATGSEAGLEMLSRKPDAFDLVITDMTMPKMNGDKLSAEILKIRPDLPIIMSTGYNANISSQTALKAGIKAFVEKPVVSADLARIVRTVLDAEKKTVQD